MTHSDHRDGMDRDAEDELNTLPQEGLEGAHTRREQEDDDPWGDTDAYTSADGHSEAEDGTDAPDVEDMADAEDAGFAVSQEDEKPKKSKKGLLLGGVAAGALVVVAVAGGLMLMQPSADRYAVLDEPGTPSMLGVTSGPQEQATASDMPQEALAAQASQDFAAPLAFDQAPAGADAFSSSAPELSSLESPVVTAPSSDTAHLTERLDDVEGKLEQVATLMLTQQDAITELTDRLKKTADSLAALEKKEPAAPAKREAKPAAKTSANASAAPSKPRPAPKPKAEPRAKPEPKPSALANLWIKGTFPATGGPAEMAWIMDETGAITDVVRIGDVINGARVTSITERAVRTTLGTIAAR